MKIKSDTSSAGCQIHIISKRLAHKEIFNKHYSYTRLDKKTYLTHRGVYVEETPNRFLKVQSEEQRKSELAYTQNPSQALLEKQH